MIDLLGHLLHFCASCVPDSQTLPPAAGMLGGAAAAAGGLGGLSGLSGSASAGSAAGANSGSASAPNEIGQPNANSPGPKPIGDQGTLARSAPGTVAVGKNADGSLTLDNGDTGLRVTTVDGGPKPIETTTPPPGSAMPIGDTPPANGPQPIGDQGTLPSSPPGTVAVGKNADGSLTLDNGDTGLRVTTVDAGPKPIETTTPPPGSAEPIGDAPPANGPQPIGEPDANSAGPTPIGDTPPANGPQPIGDQGTLPSSPPGTVAVGQNADGSLTLDNGDTGLRVTTVDAGPKPIETTTPPPGSATPIGDTTPANGPQPIAAPPTASGAQGDSADGDGAASQPEAGADTAPTADAAPTGDDGATPGGSGQVTPVTTEAGPNNSVIQTSSDGTRTITDADGTVTVINPDGTSNVSSTLPPPASGLSTGPGATDLHDPQQGQQPIGYTIQDPSPFSADGSIGPTTSISDMPNTAHIESPASAAARAAGPHKPSTP